MINRISQMAPEKDLKKYYLRDALGVFARFANEKVGTMLSGEYRFDEGTKKLMEEYQLEDNDGWVLTNVYLGKIFARQPDLVSKETKDIIDKIITIALFCVSRESSTEKQEKINELQAAIKKYTKTVKIDTFSDDVESILYSCDNESFMIHSIMTTIICMILNEYNPYDICYFNDKRKPVYYYCEVRRGSLTCCDFREISLEQSVSMAKGMDFIIKNFDEKKIREYGSPENFNIAFSNKMLSDINTVYSSRCFLLEKYVSDNSKRFSNSKNLAKWNSMGEDLNDMPIIMCAKYLDNTIRLLQFTGIDSKNEYVIHDLEENRMKLFLDLNDDTVSNNPVYEIYYRYCASRLFKYSIDITKRRRLFTHGANITYNPSDGKFNGIPFNFYVCEYIYKNKLRIYIRVHNKYVNRYFILTEGRNDYPLLCYNGYEFAALLVACALIGIDDIIEYIKKTYMDYYNDVIKKTGGFSVNIVDDNGNVVEDSHSIITYDCLEYSIILINMLDEIYGQLDLNQTNSDGKLSRTVSISETYTEEIHLSPFVRKLPIGQKVSDKALDLAHKLKVNLPDGYTIVEGHSREVRKRAK